MMVTGVAQVDHRVFDREAFGVDDRSDEMVELYLLLMSHYCLLGGQKRRGKSGKQ